MSSVPDSTGVMQWDFFVPDTDAEQERKKVRGYPLFPTVLGISLASLGPFLGGGEAKGPGGPLSGVIIRCNLATEAGI